MVREFDRIITARKEELCLKRPGAVISLEPKVIWVKISGKTMDVKGYELAKQVQCHTRRIVLQGMTNVYHGDQN